MCAVKKLACVGVLPYALVSAVRSVRTCPPRRQETDRLWTIVVISCVLGLLGFGLLLDLGGFLHLLLILAVVVLVMRLLQGWPPAALHERGRAERQRASG